MNLILFLQNINPIITGCQKDKPFDKKGNCVESCTQEELKSKVCVIANSTVETQWMTSIIPFGDKNFRYVKIASFSTNDMIAITTSESSSKRMFYGLKENGRPYFMQNSVETPYYTFEISGATRKEAELLVAKFNGLSGKEYLVSIANGDGYTELYDFENNTPYKKKTSDIFTSSNTYYTLFGCLHLDSTYQSD